MKTTPVYLDRITETHRFLARIVACLIFPFVYYKVKQVISRQPKYERNMSNISLAYDMVYTKLAFGTNYRRYRIFSFWSKNDNGKAQFLSCDRKRIYKRIGIGESRILFGDKWNTYLQYQDYFKREAIKVKLPEDQVLFHSFAKKFGTFIVKPLSSMQGKGVRLFNNLQSKDLDSLLNITEAGEYILEELIDQDKDMAVLHPSSVNTIRFVTYYNKEKLVKLYAMLRIGIGGSCIDNACAGGICAGIDMNSGIVVTKGMRQNGESYLTHPDTGVTIVGFQIPQWDELQIFIESLVRVNPKVKYAGWDLALSKKGWCVVEGNSTPSFQGYQMCMKEGIAQQVNDLLILDEMLK